MGFISDEEDVFSATKEKLKLLGNKEADYEGDNVEQLGCGKILEDFKLYGESKTKKHRKEYKFIEIIDLKDYQNSFYFSRTRILFLLDDILCVDVMCVGNYYPFGSLNDLKYILGCDQRNLLSQATELCKDILSKGCEKFQLESTKVYKTCLGKKLARLYLKDFDYNEDKPTVDLIKQKILENELLSRANVKIRGRYSAYIEDGLEQCSVENTYIQITGDDINIYLNECITVLNDLKRFLI
ncbi:hypothetical protein NGRA_0361 [Nosema granulosis]|uniref:Uncharacterized protein n=1 Tax=Nosema granulosis TaxID=83296 RepID=A0A9P6L0E8_9MICR|nr:hypothetical protein NGRA_0361 [Nosema granulosis]